MKKSIVRLASFAAVALTVAACTVALPPIEMSSWFGGTDGLTVTRGEYTAASSSPIAVDEIPAFSRGGIGLSGFAIDGGNLAPTPVLTAQQNSSPDMIRISMYLNVNEMSSATDGDLLATIEIDVDGDLQLVPGSLEVTAGINNDVLSAALENGSFYAGVVITVLENGEQVQDDWELTIDGFVANAVLSLF